MFVCGLADRALEKARSTRDQLRTESQEDDNDQQLRHATEESRELQHRRRTQKDKPQKQKNTIKHNKAEGPLPQTEERQQQITVGHHEPETSLVE